MSNQRNFQFKNTILNASRDIWNYERQRGATISSWLHNVETKLAIGEKKYFRELEVQLVVEDNHCRTLYLYKLQRAVDEIQKVNVNQYWNQTLHQWNEIN